MAQPTKPPATNVTTVPTKDTVAYTYDIEIGDRVFTIESERELSPQEQAQVALRFAKSQQPGPGNRNIAGQAIVSGLDALRGAVGEIPVVGGALKHAVPTTPGELAGDLVAVGGPLLGVAAATNPVTAPLAPWLGMAGTTARAGRLARLGAAGARAGAAGAAAAGAEAVTGGDDPLGTGASVAGWSMAAEPVAAVTSRVLMSTVGRTGVLATDAANLGRVIERDVTTPAGASIFGRVNTVDDLAQIAKGRRGIDALRNVFDQVESQVVRAVGGPNAMVSWPSMARHMGYVNQQGIAQQVPLSEALNRFKALGDTAFRTSSASGFDNRQLWRDASYELSLTLQQLNPQAAAAYEAMRRTYSRGYEIIGLLNERNVFTKGGKFDMQALQQAAFDNLRFLEQKGLARVNPRTGQATRGTLAGETFRGGGITDRDTTAAIPFLARFFSGGTGLGGRASIFAPAEMLQYSRFAGQAVPGAAVGLSPAIPRSTGVAVGARTRPAYTTEDDDNRFRNEPRRR